jgi:hypothetical protein
MPMTAGLARPFLARFFLMSRTMWEYQVTHVENEALTPEKLTPVLAELGKVGWELVSVLARATHGYTHGATFVLKRPLRDSR